MEEKEELVKIKISSSDKFYLQSLLIESAKELNNFKQKKPIYRKFNFLKLKFIYHLELINTIK